MTHHVMSSLVLLALVFCAAAAPDVLDVGKSECDKRSRRKSTLKLIKETPFSGLFRDLKNSTVFEASGESKPLLQGCGQGFRRLRSGRGHGSVPVLWQPPPPPPAAAARATSAGPSAANKGMPKYSKANTVH